MPHQPISLDALFLLMKFGSHGEWDHHGLKWSGNERDWTDLPLYNTKPIAIPDTREIWSWDDTRLIVGTCSDDIHIVNTKEYMAAIQECRDSRPKRLVGQPTTVMTIEQREIILDLAYAIAISAPHRQHHATFDAKIQWSLINKLRNAMDEAGVDRDAARDRHNKRWSR